MGQDLDLLESVETAGRKSCDGVAWAPFAPSALLHCRPFFQGEILHVNHGNWWANPAPLCFLALVKKFLEDPESGLQFHFFDSAI